MDYDGTIHPGAIDNAVGVGEMLALAEALAQSKSRPRRSIILIAPTGEEYFDLGTKFWLKHPTFPIRKIAANLNYDGGLEVWGQLGFLLDFSFNESDLGEVIRSVAAATNIPILPDPAPELGRFSRSDHFAFISDGIPALYLSGLPKMDSEKLSERAERWYVMDYHMPTDAVQADWTWDGARSMALLGLVAGMRISDRDAMPVWKTNSQYSRPRGKSLPAERR
jgi:Zn-dependent M28 family amino/carboxypeptidase